jgi:hypothetical protein
MNEGSYPASPSLTRELLRLLERRPLSGGGDYKSGRTPYDKLTVALTIAQGTSREIRRLKIHTDPITAPKAESDLPIWLRSDLDGTQAKEVLGEAVPEVLLEVVKVAVAASVALPHMVALREAEREKAGVHVALTQPEALAEVLVLGVPVGGAPVAEVLALPVPHPSLAVPLSMGAGLLEAQPEAGAGAQAL